MITVDEYVFIFCRVRTGVLIDAIVTIYSVIGNLPAYDTAGLPFSLGISTSIYLNRRKEDIVRIRQLNDKHVFFL